MAIIAHCYAPNFAAGAYHRILRIEMLCSPGEPHPRYVVHVGHYFSEEARNQNTDPMYVHQVVLPFADFPVDPRDELYARVMASPLFAGLDPVSDVQVDP